MALRRYKEDEPGTRWKEAKEDTTQDLHTRSPGMFGCSPVHGAFCRMMKLRDRIGKGLGWWWWCWGGREGEAVGGRRRRAKFVEREIYPHGVVE